MSLTKKELTEYHLSVQTKEISEMVRRTHPFETSIAGIKITVLPNVYPGGTDSELMCEVLQVSAKDEVLDLCTGTGVIALRATQLGAKSVVGVDLNPNAIKNAKLNQLKLGLGNIQFLEGSLFEPVIGQVFDVITMNPPYTDKKPANKTEICFWDENNQTTVDFFRQFRNYLKPNGRVFLGWADFSSVKLVEELAKENRATLKLVNSRKTPSGLATFLVYQIIPA
jgi:release factor glutamine methyltransferase